MILEQNVREIERSSNFEETSFKIEASAAVMKLLRSSIYSSPIQAVVREGSCNSFDAHTFAGISDRPISITLPSYLEPILKIRDYGNSMDHETVMDLYATYGRSTKGNSNNFIGAMGIGKFSPFSYVPCFQLTCIQNKQKRVYQMYLDESDKGKIALLFEENCEDENGTEVSLGIKEKDIPQFVREAQNLFRFWKVKPIVSGNVAFKHEVPEFHLGRDDSWGFRKVERNAINVSYIVMGGVPYVFNSSYVANAPDVHKNLIDKNLVLFANIGDIDIAASRETAQATNKTNKWILNKLVEIENEVRAEIENKLSAATTEYEARKLYYQIFSGEGGLNVVKSLVGTIDITWAGQKIENYCFKHNFKVHEIHIDNHYRTYKETIKVTQGNGLFFDFLGKEVFAATKIVPTLFYDLKDKGTGKLRKMGKLHLKNNNFSRKETLTVLSVNDLGELTTWCAATGINFDAFSNIDDVIKLPVPVRLGSSSAMPKGFNAQVYDPEDILDDKPDFEIISSSGNTLELANVEDFTGKFYMFRDGKKYYFSGSNNSDFADIHKLLKEISPEFAAHPVIYIFTERYNEKTKAGIRVEKFIKDTVEKLWAAHKDGFYYADILASNYHNYALGLQNLIARGKITSKPVLDFFSKISFTQTSLPHANFMQRNFFITRKPTNYGALSEEFGKLLGRAPLVKLVDNENLRHDDVASYINEQIN